MMSFSESEYPGGYDADELGQYRSLSTLAVIALLLGLSSVLAVVHPLMLIVPAAAVAVALLALRGIAVSEGGLTGSKLALCGFALAILFGVASYSRVKLRDTILLQQAKQVGERWLSLGASSRAENMLAIMTKDAVKQVAPGDDAAEVTPFFGRMLTTALLRHDPLVIALSDSSTEKKSKWKLVESDVRPSDDPPQAALRYRFDHREQECLLVLKRFPTASEKTVWLVDSWSFK